MPARMRSAQPWPWLSGDHADSDDGFMLSEARDASLVAGSAEACSKTRAGLSSDVAHVLFA